MNRSLRQQAFTIVELITVITVIGILASIVIVSYNAVQTSARDAAVLSDTEKVAGELARYATNNNGTYGASLNWYSPAGSNANIPVPLSSGNVVDVVSVDNEYCIRTFNPATNNDSLANAAQVGAQSGSCERLVASAAAGGVVPIPGSVTVTSPGTFIQLDVSWAEVIPAASYKIEYSTSSSFTSPAVANNVTGTNLTIYPTLGGTLYYVRVSTVTLDSRESAPSTAASATTTTDAISPP
jgi:prepilin-type N-terminal cleavage/methylation domain-containing protein